MDISKTCAEFFLLQFLLWLYQLYQANVMWSKSYHHDNCEKLIDFWPYLARWPYWMTNIIHDHYEHACDYCNHGHCDHDHCDHYDHSEQFWDSLIFLTWPCEMILLNSYDYQGDHDGLDHCEKIINFWPDLVGWAYWIIKFTHHHDDHFL